jgi:hypothetical protein
MPLRDTRVRVHALASGVVSSPATRASVGFAASTTLWGSTPEAETATGRSPHLGCLSDAAAAACPDLATLDRAAFEAMLLDDAERADKQREAEFAADLLHAFERRVLLTVLDRHWPKHLYEMDYLQEGIGLQLLGQHDPWSSTSASD